MDYDLTVKDVFLSTPSARRATYCMEDDAAFEKAFLSTPSARRATRDLFGLYERNRYFYPRPPRGGRLLYELDNDGRLVISIHALREEGDGLDLIVTNSQRISIHALREEGDGSS